jgi:hypothetical protein
MRINRVRPEVTCGRRQAEGALLWLSSVGRTVAVLGTTQTLAWASSYYLPAMLAVPMARTLGVAVSTVFAAFSAALVVSAILGPYAGRAIDRWGGKPVMALSNLVFALGLSMLGWSQGTAGLFAAWLVMGLGMGGGLYEAAFASVVRLYGAGSRGAITGITLLAGFASTVGWPLSSFVEAHYGWRTACLTWAALHVLLGLPLNLLAAAKADSVAADAEGARTVRNRASCGELEAHQARRHRVVVRICVNVVREHRDGGAPSTASATDGRLIGGGGGGRRTGRPRTGRERGCWNTDSCAVCIHCCRRAWPRCCIRSAPPFWAWLAPRPQQYSGSCMARATAS